MHILNVSCIHSEFGIRTKDAGCGEDVDCCINSGVFQQDEKERHGQPIQIIRHIALSQIMTIMVKLPCRSRNRDGMISQTDNALEIRVDMAAGA